MFTFDPSTAEPDENQIKFSVYVHYVEAMYSVTTMAHQSLRDAAAHQAAEQSFRRLQPRRHQSTLQIERALRNAWLTELLTLIPLFAEDLTAR